MPSIKYRFYYTIFIPCCQSKNALRLSFSRFLERKHVSLRSTLSFAKQNIVGKELPKRLWMFNFRVVEGADPYRFADKPSLARLIYKK